MAAEPRGRPSLRGLSGSIFSASPALHVKPGEVLTAL